VKKYQLEKVTFIVKIVAKLFFLGFRPTILDFAFGLVMDHKTVEQV